MQELLNDMISQAQAGSCREVVKDAAMVVQYGYDTAVDPAAMNKAQGVTQKSMQSSIPATKLKLTK